MVELVGSSMRWQEIAGSSEWQHYLSYPKALREDLSQ
jgi:hypothetical protein